MMDRHYLVECLIIRDENQYLLEHLKHGADAGIEHFYIYDNISGYPVSAFLQGTEFEERCTVEIWHNTECNQLDCYAHFLREHRDDAIWCAFIDTDEMLEGDLLTLCKKNEDFLSLKIEQIVHGCNGQAHADYSKTLTERFRPHVIKMHMSKMVVQLKYLDRQYPHHSYIDGERAVGIPMRKWLRIIYWNEECQLHHYFYKSFEEWIVKCKRGNVFAKSKGWRFKMFFKENTISEEDRASLMEEYGVDMDYFMGYGSEGADAGA